MKNRRNIIESELPPQNPLDIWMKDGKFYRSTKKGWTLIEDQMEFTDSKQMSKSTATSGTIGVNKDTGEASIYNDVAKKWSPLGGGLTETTWQELKDKRDNGQLIPGSLYRITDYQCTTTQENTQSAGHQFDIVLLALSENKLAEEGWAMEHPTDVYDVTFADGVTKKCYIYKTDELECNIVDIDTLLGLEHVGYGEIGSGEELIINSVLLIATTNIYDSTELETSNLTYNYFQNSNLSAWKVWYCLDNDKSRFAWADDDNEYWIIDDYIGEKAYHRPYGDIPELGLYFWDNDEATSGLWSKTLTPKVGDLLYNDSGEAEGNIVTAVGGFGRGVIYRLIDEFNNDIKYDFKNIQFKRTITDGQYDEEGEETWCYTLNIWYNDMCQDASIVGNTLPNDEGFVNGVYDNNFGYATAYDVYIDGVNTFAFALGNNVVLSFDDNGEYQGIYSNTIGNAFYGNTIGNGFFDNTIGNNFYSNTIGDTFHSNTVGNEFYSNTVGYGVFLNMIGNDFSSKTIANTTARKNYGNGGVELATKDDLQ